MDGQLAISHKINKNLLVQVIRGFKVKCELREIEIPPLPSQN